MPKFRSAPSPDFFVTGAVVVFALSGCSGLVYQAIWSHYLGLYLGHAAYAQCLVLAIFMGGLALGSWLVSRRSLEWSDLLVRYAIVEAAIGVFGLLFHTLFVAGTNLAYDRILPAMPSDGAVAMVKWASGALLILPQSILLGMTFPLMANGVIRRIGETPGSIISRLYFGNSIGAAAGAMVATFVLLPTIGLPGAMEFAGVLNLFVALLACILAYRRVVLAAKTDWLPDNSSTEPLPHPQPAAISVSLTRLLLLAAFVTGTTSFVYEIVWVRMLSLVCGTTLHAFELMLTAFIGGLALGSWVLRRRIDRFRNLMRAAAYIQMAMGLAALATMMLYGRSFEWIAFFMHSLARNASGYVLFNVITALIALVIMLPAAFFAGMTLPMFSLALTRNGAQETAIGRIYAANTLGAIVGVVIAVQWLMPMLGLKLSMTAAAIGDIALGLVLLRRAVERRHPRTYLAALVVSGLLAIVFIHYSPFDQRELASAVYRTGAARIPDDAKILFYRDGSTASITLADKQGIRSIATNGKSDSAIQMAESGIPTGDENTTVLLAALPLAIQPEARSAAVIGIGTGLTTNTLLGAPGLERVDTIEIEPAMVTAAHGFGRFSQRVFDDPRSRIHLEDAKVYFSAHNARYDIIISEPSNPWVSGVASLFTEEFYAHAARHLAPHGLLVQWVQLYEIDDALVATIANALSRQFQDYRLYLSNDVDLLIVASADGAVGQVDGQIFSIDALKASLQRISIRSNADLRLHELGGKREFAPFFQALSETTNSDYFPILSLEAPRARFASLTAARLLELPHSDLPLMEMTRGLSPPQRGTPISIDPNFTKTQDVSAARDIRARLLDENQPSPVAAGVDEQMLSVVSALREYDRTCGRSANADIAITWMYQAGAATIPYLSPEELQPVWIKDRLRACQPWPGSAAAMEDFLVALGARDAQAIGDRARDLLTEHGASLTPEVADYLVRALLMADLSAGRPEQVEETSRTLGRQFLSAENRVGERIYLQALAASIASTRLQRAPTPALSN
ncbi:MAG: fused MFS/spermidine synthase [Rudaea sp.]|nr:fused MFS/spermidine synthase [Rudaea sp.]